MTVNSCRASGIGVGTTHFGLNRASHERDQTALHVAEAAYTLPGPQEAWTSSETSPYSRLALLSKK